VRHRRLAFALLALIAVVHIGFVADSVRNRGALDHDEIISQLAATGHLDDWERVIGGAKPTGTWETGADLRAFLEVDSHSSPAATGSNLGHLDVHPPLFFWALLGARAAGLGILWSGPIVNIIAALLAAAILYALLLEVLEEPLLAVAGVAVFLFSPALIRSVGFARQYPFMMLASVALIWTTVRLRERPTSIPLFLSLFAVALFGLLSETVFVFAFVGTLLSLALYWRRDNLRALGYACLAGAGAAAVALAVFPSYGAQYTRVESLARTAVPVSTDSRFHRWITGFFDFVTISPAAPAHIVVPIVSVLAVALLATTRWWLPPVSDVIRRQPVSVVALCVGGTAFVVETVAYLLGKTPGWATGWDYIIIFWPAIVLLLAVAARRFARPAITLLVVAALLGGFALNLSHSWQHRYATQRRAVAAASGATLVIADCLMRGYTPGAAMWVPKHTPFLLTAPGSTPPPPLPAGADLSRAVLFHAADCGAAARNIDQLLATLGLARGSAVGPIALIEVYKLYRLPANAPSGAGT
jgi:hypothetical protein